MLSLLLACIGDTKLPVDTFGDTDADADTDSDTDTDTDTDSDTDTDTDTDSDTDVAENGLLVLCGGGSEGEVGDTSAWSYTAYSALLSRGDVTGDGLIQVAVLADSEQTEWVPGYFASLGADLAFNLTVDTVDAANASTLVTTFADVDAVFIKGGDQGSYYDLWNDSELETQLLAVFERGGSIGGTSAGAMSQSAYALAGSNDYISADVLLDSHSEYLSDVSDGGSSIHADFLGLLPGALVDTHFSNRGRLGRLAGAMALAIDEGAPSTLLGVGLDEQTCLTVDGTTGTVNGGGAMSFLRAGSEPAMRVAGEPLVWAGLRLDRLTHGWQFDLVSQAPIFTALPAGAEPVVWDGADDAQSAEDWQADGFRVSDQEGFEAVIEAWPLAYAVRAGTRDTLLMNAVGLMDAHDSGLRGVNEEAMFRTLYGEPGLVGFLVGEGGVISREAATPERVVLAGSGDEPLATMVIDASGATYRSLSPTVSPEDAGDGALHAAGLTGVVLHILYSEGSDGRVWDMGTREPVE